MSKSTPQKTIFKLCLTLVLMVLLAVLESFLGEDIKGWKYFIIVLVTLLVLMMVFIFITKAILSIAQIQYLDINSFSVEEMCHHFNNTVCCVNMAIDSLKSAYLIRLDDEIAQKYNLFSKDQLLERERGVEKGEVWMISYDMTAEALDGEEAKIREYNLKNGIKYRLFYINNPRQKYSEVQDNIYQMEKKYKGKMKLYPYEKQISIFSFLFTLFGIIMFLDQDKNVYDAYFMLHSSNDKIKEPIYMRMSYCMEKKYNKILRSIMDEARNPRIIERDTRLKKIGRRERVKRRIKGLINKL